MLQYIAPTNVTTNIQIWLMASIPLKNISQLGLLSNIWKNIKCSKPPTRYCPVMPADLFPRHFISCYLWIPGECSKLGNVARHLTNFQGKSTAGWWLTYPSEKIMEFVSWDDDIPNRWENKIHVPNHQPENHSSFHGECFLTGKPGKSMKPYLVLSAIRGLYSPFQ